MLRLPPSQIGLGPNDLSWHLQRLRTRQAERAAQPRTGPSRSRPPCMQGQDISLPYRFPHPPSSPADGNRYISKESILSEEPVPQDSRIFWDGIVAQNLSRGLDEPGAIDGVSEVSTDGDDSYGIQDQDLLEQDPGPDDLTQDDRHDEYSTGDEGDHCVRLRFPAGFAQHHICEGNIHTVPQDAHGDGENHLAATNRGPFLESDKTGLAAVEVEVSDDESQSSDQMDLDGSADGRVPCRGRRLSLSSELSTLRIGRLVRSPRVWGGMPNLRNRTTSDHEILATSPLLHASEEEVTPPAPPQDLEVYRRRSATLPRSRLHISHEAASSSPEKLECGHYHTDIDIGYEPTLNHPSRSRKTYRPRSQSYSFLGSEVEESNTSTYYQHHHSPMYNSEPIELPSSPPEPVSASDPEGFQPSPDRLDSYFSSPHHSRQQAETSPQLPHGQHTTPRVTRNLLRTRAEVSPSLHPDALPPPFSASARTVSFNVSLPSSSPASQYYSPMSTPLAAGQTIDDVALSESPASLPPRTSLPSFRYDGSEDPAFQARLEELNHSIAYHSSEIYQYPTPSPRTQHRLQPPTAPHSQPPLARYTYIPSPSPPRAYTPHRTMRVYNDRLPAHSQPQTPLHFRRHRPVIDAAFTAPAGYARTRSSRHVTPTNSRLRRWGTRTPSVRVERRLFSGRSESPASLVSLVDEEQENTSVEEELVRRLETLRRWRNVGEMEREVREGRLESTPPREVRLGWD
ncbi:hypothetical protein MMC16_003433 [Acarospora aff. strigata]|nr:hypothetical protein [Acarospora aff. strigata]